MDDERKDVFIPTSLSALIAEAREKQLWLWCSYQDLWFSPDQLEAANARGKFIWGVINWTLRDPKERLAEAVVRAQRASEDVSRILAQISPGG